MWHFPAAEVLSLLRGCLGQGGIPAALTPEQSLPSFPFPPLIPLDFGVSCSLRCSWREVGSWWWVRLCWWHCGSLVSPLQRCRGGDSAETAGLGCVQAGLWQRTWDQVQEGGFIQGQVWSGFVSHDVFPGWKRRWSQVWAGKRLSCW